MSRLITLPQQLLSHISPSRISASPTTPQTVESADTKGSYFSSYSPRTLGPHVPSPTDGHSITSSFTQHSVSSIASDASTEANTLSLESSRYLTPPQALSDTDAPPYRPRSVSSGSLDMTRAHPPRVRRSHRGQVRRKRTKNNSERYGTKTRLKKRRPTWWLPGTDVTSSAPLGFEDRRDSGGKHLVEGYPLRKSVQVNIDDHDGLKRLLSLPAPPLMSRRWSSIGPSSRHGTYNSHSARSVSQTKSRTWAQNVRPDDIIQAVRSKLTLRKVSGTQVETPASITLRRASGMTFSSRVSWLPTITNGSFIKGISGLENTNQKESNGSTYLITSRDVESITQLIRSSLTNNNGSSISPPQLPKAPQVKSPTFANKERSPSITKKGLLPRPSVVADVAVTVSDVIPAPSGLCVSFAGLPNPDAVGRRSSMVSKVFSKNSVHEIIWEGSPPHSSSVSSSSEIGQGGGRNLSTFSGGLEVRELLPKRPDGLPQSMTTRRLLKGEQSPDVGPMGEQVFYWELGNTVTDTEPLPPFKVEFPLLSPSMKESESIISRKQDSSGPDRRLHEVISFPALPHRKYTNDWVKPLPDFATAMRASFTLNTPRSMYSAGIDATGCVPKAPLIMKSAPVTPQIEISHFDIPGEDCDTRTGGPLSPQKEHGRSIVLQHPLDRERIGDFSKLGHAIGTSSGMRRRSSTRSTRIRFEHSTVGEDLEDRRPWRKPRKDSGYPLKRSRSTSPEDETPSPPSTVTPDASRRQSFFPTVGRVGKGVMWRTQIDRGDRWKDRDRLIEETAPKLVVKDRAGIYASLTGANEPDKQVEGDKSCVDECAAHEVKLPSSEDARQPSVDWIG